MLKVPLRSGLEAQGPWGVDDVPGETGRAARSPTSGRATSFGWRHSPRTRAYLEQQLVVSAGGWEPFLKHRNLPQ